MRKFLLILFPVFFSCLMVSGQSFPINAQQFFLDERVVEVTFTTDLKKLRMEKKVPTWQAANITLRFSDSVQVTETIQVQTRGNFRKANCDIASLLLQFKGSASPKLSPLKKLKMVGGCNLGTGNSEELLLKEFLLYKIYNQLTNMSFRVRLLHVTYKDSRQKVKSYTQYAFLLEGTTDLAKRNNCKEIENIVFQTEQTNRQHTTLVSIFEYMIGNTDWSVPDYHNVKLLVPKNDSMANPFIVPYDFDYCGTVEAPYALPPERFGINSVRERVYRGFPRTMEEISQALDIFQSRKEVIYYTVNNFSLLREKVRKDIIFYLEDFYKSTNQKREAKFIFIDRARKE